MGLWGYRFIGLWGYRFMGVWGYRVIGLWVLHEILNDVLGVVAVLFVGDVNPARSGSVAFPDKLMELAVIHNPFEPLFADGFGGDAEVSRLARHVLACCAASYGLIQSRRAIAGAYHNRGIEVRAERFEDVDAELLEIRDDLKRRRIVNASCRVRFRAKEFAELEVRRKLNIVHNVLFLS